MKLKWTNLILITFPVRFKSTCMGIPHAIQDRSSPNFNLFHPRKPHLIFAFSIHIPMRQGTVIVGAFPIIFAMSCCNVSRVTIRSIRIAYVMSFIMTNRAYTFYYRKYPVRTLVLLFRSCRNRSASKCEVDGPLPLQLTCCKAMRLWRIALSYFGTFGIRGGINVHQLNVNAITRAFQFHGWLAVSSWSLWSRLGMIMKLVWGCPCKYSLGRKLGKGSLTTSTLMAGVITLYTAQMWWDTPAIRHPLHYRPRVFRNYYHRLAPSRLGSS